MNAYYLFCPLRIRLRNPANNDKDYTEHKQVWAEYARRESANVRYYHEKYNNFFESSAWVKLVENWERVRRSPEHQKMVVEAFLKIRPCWIPRDRKSHAVMYNTIKIQLETMGWGKYIREKLGVSYKIIKNQYQ